MKHFLPTNKSVKVWIELEGKVLTHSPSRQVFTDQNGKVYTDYHTIKWFIDNDLMLILPRPRNNPLDIVNWYKRKF